MSINTIFSALEEQHNKALFYYDLPGLAVHATVGEEDYYSFSGWQNAVTKAPLKEHHIFHMASVTKLFVSTAILKLCEQGMAVLDGKVADYLPQFKMADERYKQLTLRQMLSHTSGMPDDDEYHWDKFETDSEALMRYVTSKAVTDAHLLWDPSETKFAYSNIAYEILGAAIANISGMEFEEYVSENIFKPLGMNDSDLLTFRRDMNVVCAPHEKDEDNNIKIVKHFPYTRGHGPSSTLTATLKDMSIWGRAVVDQKILKPESFQEAWKVYATVPNNNEGIGLAWFRREQDGHVLYGHEGTDDGFRSSFWVCPELKISITVCSNISKAPVKRINRETFEFITKNL
jgi:CubicO group peptidase (beta-lactamase class C family)